MTNNNALADNIREVIVREFRNAFERAVEDEDIRMQALYISDYGQALSVCRDIELGRWSDAKEQLFHMDTSPRENLYELLESVMGSELVDRKLVDRNL